MIRRSVYESLFVGGHGAGCPGSGGDLGAIPSADVSLGSALWPRASEPAPPTTRYRPVCRPWEWDLRD
ncbi:hypothetical protein SKAU_G00085480 [Synaphobranchus kaupii]|uniref:Uncharacterized protein n=1 Tax=Synaphobranchus kaupii TaxID=118154 RepID=A0A9Q1J3Q6_SYNKA|nr:hypothetical protein SKAU_G00085480 [Synaphobranchus kaupii]